MHFFLSRPGTGKLNFDAFSEIAGHFLEEEDAEAMQEELKEAFRLYDREGKKCHELAYVLLYSKTAENLTHLSG